jgi:hypothetical protein
VPRISYTWSPENQAKTMDEPKHNTAPQVINGRINGRFAQGHSGNPGGSPEATRRAFNKRFLLDLAEDWQQHGREVFKRVRRESPASYLKVCAMLVPRELKVEHNQGVKAMTDEQIEQAIEAIQAMLEQQAKVIEGTTETVALPAPDVIGTDRTRSWMWRTPRSGRESASRGKAGCHRLRGRDLTG